MATVAQIRAAIKVKLLTIAGIGQVHDFERYAKDQAEFEKLYRTEVAADQFRILGWNFYRETTGEFDLNVTEVRRLHSWRITGYMSWSDEDGTAKLFDDLVELIAAAFRTDRTLGGVADDIKDLDNEFGPSGMQVEGIEPVMFAGVLCHRARLRLVTETTEPNV